RGTAQNPDTFFQSREAGNPFYDACPGVVQETMDRFAKLTGRKYKLFDYVGHPQAERVIVMMGSGAEVAHETVEHLVAKGKKVGLVKVRLYRPFSIKHLAAALPKSALSVAVLDRTKEPGATGDPLYLDVLTALSETSRLGNLRLVGGRYGLSSKDFTPAMTKAVFDELKKKKPKNHFTVGINDDVSHTSLTFNPDFDIEPKNVVRCVFWGLGADGTVGANKNSIKIIGEETPNFAQGYFVYDSKKSGGVTVSHLRFGPDPIRSTYLVQKASFVACHAYSFLEKYDVLAFAAPGAVFLINAPFPQAEVWDQLPCEVQEQIIAKKLKVYVIDAYEVAKHTGMGTRINTIMQTCFFAISGVLPRDEAIAEIKKSIKKTYGKKGDKIVKMNYAAV
ncbi:MAG: 2-oxoacid:acceptor oxidoreductase family protein, partial [Hyphomicrobiaceae bacterium]|nr:2-oxoacid:acceptor oxidoreductase family protein [Hyphomicrobiaceae bacterium]